MSAVNNRAGNRDPFLFLPILHGNRKEKNNTTASLDFEVYTGIYIEPGS
jgi:hypothetical protein